MGYGSSLKTVYEDAQVTWTTGAAIAMPTELFRALNGFDEIYQRGYFEDVDLCMRARYQFESEIWYIADSVFTHYAGQSTSPQSLDESLIATRSFMHNKMIFHKRWDDYIEPECNSILSPTT